MATPGCKMDCNAGGMANSTRHSPRTLGPFNRYEPSVAVVVVVTGAYESSNELVGAVPVSATHVADTVIPACPGSPASQTPSAS
jgi:hypothetical protein